MFVTVEFSENASIVQFISASAGEEIVLSFYLILRCTKLIASVCMHWCETLFPFRRKTEI
jgi:hypothetical protein